VHHTETDETLKIRVFNISKKELGDAMKDSAPSSHWPQSPLLKKIYDVELGTSGGQPFGTIVGDYCFDHSPPDVSVLRGMAQMSATAHAPFLTAASPALMNIDSWLGLATIRDSKKIFEMPEYAAWNSLRGSDESRYLALTMPRFLARLPYGAKTNPVNDFAFEEDTEGDDHSKFVWCNSAYSFATNVARAFKRYGWCARIRGIESGGLVEGLPTHLRPAADGGLDVKSPTEIAIADRREAELSQAGLVPLVYWKNTDYAVFLGAQSLIKPRAYMDPVATANSKLAASLSYLFPVCRFAHYLQCICWEKIGLPMQRADLERELNAWIRTYVSAKPGTSDETDPKYPLAEARVNVEEVAGQPGHYQVILYIRPHYQLEELTASIRITLLVGRSLKL
jgi:type VI secretion system protein ImpC